MKCTLANDVIRARVCDYIRQAPIGYVVTVEPEKRSLDQNAKLWPMLQDVSKQVEWYGRYLSREVWKDIFTAAYKRQKTYPGIDGGFVVTGASTSRMNKREFSDLIEIIAAFGSERGVKWSEKALEDYAMFGHKK